MISKKGQVAIFVIIALVIVAGVAIYFVIRGDLESSDVPVELRPVYDSYLNCIEMETITAVQLAAGQGGRIETGDYIPGSDWAPFSSQLNFMGAPVPYWYYVAGNGILKENVPSKSELEIELEDFIAEGLSYCDFESFYSQGFDIDRSGGDVSVTVGKERIRVEVSSALSVSKGEISGRKISHVVEIDSKLGKFFDLALEIYDNQKRNAFLEQYALDVLYLYAPVDGVELQCGPKIWGTQQVVSDLKEGLEANIAHLKFRGDYYDLNDDTDEYFVIDQSVDESVNLMYSRDWPTKVEIYGEGVDEDILVTEAIGTQAGMGMMGFCYVPYHFVYDVSFPVMIQLYDREEMFQFPVVVVIDKNVAREAEVTAGSYEEEFDICEFNDKEIEVNVYDANLRKVDANVSFECFDKRCRLGETVGGTLRTFVPKCVNGYLNLKAEGFADKKYLMSTNTESYADVILEREFPVDVRVEVDGQETEDMAVVSFVRDDGVTKSVALPEFAETELSEGNYEVTVYVYGDSAITIPASTNYECVDAPKEGLLGFFGVTEEECFDVTIPETKIENALIGGGKVDYYILESELQKGGLTVRVAGLPSPTSLEQLQDNFALFDMQRPNLVFG